MYLPYVEVGGVFHTIMHLALPHVGKGMLHMIMPLVLSVKKVCVKKKNCPQQDSNPGPQDNHHKNQQC